MSKPSIPQTGFKSTEILRGIPLGIEPNVLKSPIRVFIDITRRCNLRCKHCYASKKVEKELDTNEMKSLLEELSKNKVFEVIFTGGEPFLRKDFFELLEFANSLGLTSIILSNVTTITKEDGIKLSNLNVMRVQTSLDGLKETHDEFRGVRGTFEDTVRGIKNLTDAGMNVRVNCAQLSKNVKEIDALLELCANIGVVEFAWYKLLPSGRGREAMNLEATPEEILPLASHLGELAGRYRDKLLFLYSIPLSGKVIRKDFSFKKNPVLNPSCGAGRQFCCIIPNGGVKPCVFWDDDVCEYNIREKPLKWIWNNTKLFGGLRSLNIECRNCEAFPWCGGSCRLGAYLHGGVYAKHPLCVDSGACTEEKKFEVKNV